MTRPSDFDVNTPAGTASPREGDNELRRIKEFSRNGYLDLTDTDRTAAGRQTHPLFATSLTTQSLMLGTTAITATGADLNRTADLQFFTIAPGATGAATIGTDSPLAQAIGIGATVGNNAGAALSISGTVGQSATASLAIFGSTTAASGVAVGPTSVSNGLFATGVGPGATARGTGSSAFGDNSMALFSGAVAVGSGATAGTQSTAGTDNSTAVGHDSSAVQGNAMALGNEATTTADNHINLGNSSITQINAAVTSITALSDQRDKTDIAELPTALGLDFVNAVAPKEFKRNHRARYNYDVVDGNRVYRERGESFANNEYTIGSKKNTNKSIGFIAQDMEAYLSDNSLDEYKIVAGPETALQMSKTELIGVLWKAVQQLSARVELLENGG